LYSAALYALLANLFFAASSLSFAEHSHKYGSLWVNSFKAIVSFLVIFVVFIVMGYASVPITSVSLLYMLSGLLGLAIGDFYLVLGFQKIGPARTLLLFGVQPIFFLLIDKFFFGLSISSKSLIGVAFMLLSLVLVFVDKKKNNSYNWSLFGIFCGFFGVVLDFLGVLITKWCMNQADHSTVEVYFWRILGALIGLLLFHLVFKKPIFRFNQNESFNQKGLFVVACLSGTLISLWLYLEAIKIGPLSSVTAVAVTGPLFAALFEWLFYKKSLTIGLVLSLIAFGLGFSLLS